MWRLVLSSRALPLHFAALDEEHLASVRFRAIGDQRWTDRPEEDTFLAREVFASMPEAWVLREEFEGTLQVTDYPLGDGTAEVLLDVEGDAMEPLAGLLA